MTEFVWLIVVTDCSDCFRLERLRGRAWTHWKVRPCHGAHPSRTPGMSCFSPLASSLCSTMVKRDRKHPV